MLKVMDDSFDSTDSSLTEQPIITKDIVTYSKVELDHLVCNQTSLPRSHLSQHHLGSHQLWLKGLLLQLLYRVYWQVAESYHLRTHN